MKSIALVFDGLQIGGIERVGADYAKLMIDLGYEVSIINLNPKYHEMEIEFPNKCKFIHIRYPRKLAPEQYAQLIKKARWGAYIYPVMGLILDVINLIYKILIRINYKNKFDIIIAFSGHFNDLTFVEKNYFRAHKRMAWLHGALYSYILISDGFLNLYKKIKNLIVLVDDAQEEVFYANRSLNLNITKMYNPTFIANRKIDPKNVLLLKQKYGPFILMVSRFEYPHKDQFTVVKALDILRKKYGNDYSLVFVGTGPDEDKVKKLVYEIGGDLPDHVYFEGNRFNVQDYYSAAQILVHASVAGEGLPTIIIEALAYKLPMVVTDSKTGPREILGNNEYGLLCKIQDPDDMAKCIHELISDTLKYEKYSQKSLLRLKAFEPETIKNQLRDVLEKIEEQ